MLTAEIKVNGRPIALIEVQNVKVLSDEPGDFIGDHAFVSEYEVNVNRLITQGPNLTNITLAPFTVIHDSRFGWQGLVNKITEKIMPVVVETVSEEDLQ